MKLVALTLLAIVVCATQEIAPNTNVKIMSAMVYEECIGAPQPSPDAQIFLIPCDDSQTVRFTNEGQFQLRDTGLCLAMISSENLSPLTLKWCSDDDPLQRWAILGAILGATLDSQNQIVSADGHNLALAMQPEAIQPVVLRADGSLFQRWILQSD